MEYSLGKAPKLNQNDPVVVQIGESTINGIIVGVATNDDTLFPMYIVECTDGQLPREDYRYSSFIAPLGNIFTRQLI